MTDDPNVRSEARPEGEQPAQAAPSPEGPEVDAVEEFEELGHDRPAGGADAASAAGSEPAAEASEPADELTLTRIALEERTRDLQRLQAEYVNYKRRVERDRELIKENATFAALAPIIDVLDTIDRAREHEPLEGGFKAVAEQLERAVAGVGLVKFGASGDAFDPLLHEALSHIGTDPEVEVTTCKVVAKAGYKIGDRVVRAAQVLVVDPAEG